MRFFLSGSNMACKRHTLLVRKMPVTFTIATKVRVVSSVAPKSHLTEELQHSSISTATGSMGQITHTDVSSAVVNGAGVLSTKTSTPNSSGTTIDDTTAVLTAADCVRAALHSHQQPLVQTAGSVNDTNVPPSSLLTPIAKRQEGNDHEEILTAVAMLLEKDMTFGPRLLSSLSGDSLRLMLVIATAREYFGQEDVEAQLRAVDKDRDDNISSQDYDAWMDTAVRERAAKRFVVPRTMAKVQDNTTTNSNTSNTTTTTTSINSTTTTTTKDPCYISWGLWHRIALSAAVPFMAFGVLDNAIFVTVGDAIDKTFANAFRLSTMAAAALGGVVSGTVGIQVHGLAVRLTQKSRLAQAPKLTLAQYTSPSCGSATRMGSTFGMMVGLFLGMAPLLLLSPSAS